MTTITLYTSGDGYRTWRQPGDPAPVLRVTCPLGPPDATCGQITITDLTDMLSVAKAATMLVDVLKADPCRLHQAADPAAPAITGHDLDAALAAIDPKVLAGLAKAAIAGRPTVVTVAGMPTFVSSDGWTVEVTGS